MHTPIKPALTETEWHQRQCGAISVDVLPTETHVAVRDPDGQLVSVSGDDELFALMALANCAMSENDPRKLCRRDLAVLSVLIEEYYRSCESERNILGVANMLYDKLSALLPDSANCEPPSES
jgi:hypothetical protein